jgi:Tfp pilus assembly protein PilX
MKMTVKNITETGNITVIALMILIILTLIGISAGRTSNTDVTAARNLIPHKQDFYVAEAGQNMEAVKIGMKYPLTISDTRGFCSRWSRKVVPQNT